MSMYGQICYGILFEEDAEFPWSDDYEDHEGWWRDVNGYKSLWSPFTEHGEYKPGVKSGDPRIKAYFKHKYDWDAENPFPIAIVDYGYCDFSEVILAVSSSLVVAEEVEEFNPANLVVSEDERNALLNFCQKWNIELDDPRWWLGTYQG